MASLAVAMCVVIVLANIGANKLTMIFGFPIDCGVLFFPLTYLITDIANEKLGCEKAKTLIWYGFITSFSFASGVLLIKMMPEYYDWHNQGALDKFFELSIRLSAASFISFLIGLYINVCIFTYLKQRFAKFGILARFFFSTAAGAFIENMFFYFIAFSGLIELNTLFIMMVVQYLIKLVYNFISSIIVVKLFDLKK